MCAFRSLSHCLLMQEHSPRPTHCADILVGTSLATCTVYGPQTGNLAQLLLLLSMSATARTPSKNVRCYPDLHNSCGDVEDEQRGGGGGQPGGGYRQVSIQT